jgi:hypothetical protein
VVLATVCWTLYLIPRIQMEAPSTAQVNTVPAAVLLAIVVALISRVLVIAAAE